MVPPNSTGEWQYLTRGVFPTAPVKPFTACDMKLLESTGLNAAALAGIMIYELLKERNGERARQPPHMNLAVAVHRR
jgi:hypothetical protein